MGSVTELRGLQSLMAVLAGDERKSVARAERALAGVVSYAKVAKLADSDEPLSVILVDLLSDLNHLCDVAEIDFDDLLRLADRHYAAEVGK